MATGTTSSAVAAASADAALILPPEVERALQLWNSDNNILSNLTDTLDMLTTAKQEHIVARKGLADQTKALK